MGIQGTDRSRCVALGVGENTVNLAHTPIVIRMGMGGIDGLQLQSGLQYFSDHPVGIGTGPLAVDQNALFFTHDNDAGDVKSILRGHKYLCGQLVFSVSNGNGLHKYASFNKSKIVRHQVFLVATTYCVPLKQTLYSMSPRCTV